MSVMRPVNGFGNGSGMFWLRMTRARRYSTPPPMARLPLDVCQAMVGWNEVVFRSASREMKRPTHGSCQSVRRPHAANTPTPSVRLLPMGTTAYALGGANVCRSYLPSAPAV